MDFLVVCNGARHAISVNPDDCSLALNDHPGEETVAAEVLEALGAKFRCLEVRAQWEPLRRRTGRMSSHDVEPTVTAKLPPVLQSVLVNGYKAAAATKEFLLNEEDRAAFARRSIKLRFIGGGSRKFWNALLDGSYVVVHYGKIGTTGGRTEKSFDTREKAQQEFTKLVNGKLKKGYAVVS